MNKKDFEERLKDYCSQTVDLIEHRNKLWQWVEKYAEEMCKKQREEIDKELSEPYFGWCDVEGCDEEGCSGGNAWRDSGYWTVCSQHAQDHRDKKPQPKMKRASVEKENSRDKKTGYLPSIKE